jgi:hypothetical protein
MSVWKGMVAGLIATLAMLGLLLLVSATGLVPGLETVGALPGLDPGAVSGPATGWLIHLLLGTVLWGSLFALLYPGLPGGSVMKGIVFSVVPWLVTMLVLMPAADAGLFALRLGLAVPVATLILHAIFGAVLGVVYERMIVREPALI